MQLLLFVGPAAVLVGCRSHIISHPVHSIASVVPVPFSVETIMTATFSIEHAKSARGKCKKCKVQIQKGELRLGKNTPGPDFDMQSWFHPGCLPFPRDLQKEGVTVETFVTDILRDDTEEHILETEPDKIIKLMEDKPKTPKKKKEGDGGKIDKIKARIEEQEKEAEEDGPPSKKQKTLTEEEEGEMEVYGIYAKKTNDELKDILRWNIQPVSGTKNDLLMKVIDGHMHGRIGRCISCNNGRLKIADSSGEKVVCMGYFDEDTQTRIPCTYTGSILDVPRFQPWYTQKPTEEEMKIMEAEKKGIDPNADDTDVSELTALAEKLDWDLDSKKGIQTATADIIEMLTTGDGPKVDIPEDPQKAKMAIGKIVVNNKDSTAPEVVKLIVQQYGLTEQNTIKAERKKKEAKDACKVAANSAILEAIQELRDLYFAEGNRNAGMSYVKAANAIIALEFEITEDNAKSLGKPGKNKVDGIGKGTADKMYEFLTTGKIEKLEEKRANAAA